MPRPLRADYPGEIYHALKRGNARNKLFFKDGDYEAFERVISEGLKVATSVFRFRMMIISISCVDMSSGTR